MTTDTDTTGATQSDLLPGANDATEILDTGKGAGTKETKEPKDKDSKPRAKAAPPPCPQMTIELGTRTPGVREWYEKHDEEGFKRLYPEG